MPATDRDVLNKVYQWLQFEDEDLLLARHGLTLQSSVPYRLIAYHAQQTISSGACASDMQSLLQRRLLAASL